MSFSWNRNVQLHLLVSTLFTVPFSAIVLNKNKTTLYACTTDNNYTVSKYVRNDETKTWDKADDLQRSETDETEVVLQMRLDKHEKVLLGTTSNGFIIWDFNEEGAISEEAVVLKLPYGTRNISTKMLQSNSIMLSAHKNYAIAGVRLVIGLYM